MDILHRKPPKTDTKMGRDCQFCRRQDPNIIHRHPMDRLVSDKSEDTASTHITEDGYVKHRMVEVTARVNVARSVAPAAA
jgi:hypothetical protein